ncbi:MAG: hypothetical protein ABSG34_17420 [Candidatus Sulfotelmatobacter sp.]|jgi:hypothetical protein
MSTIQDVAAEDLARLFHHYRQALMHDSDPHENENEQRSSSWERTPPTERKLMVAAARLALLELSTTPASSPGRKYYGKPGEADWGC